jgi:hypothetical protein
VRSIIRQHGSEDEGPTHEQPVHENDNALLEAAGFDSSRLAEIDADTAYALQLQQEEYSRESLMPNRQRYLPFQVEPDEESNPAIFVGSDAPQFTSDAEFAAYLQEQENQRRQRLRRPAFPFYPIQQRSNPGSTQTSETDEAENESHPLARSPLRRPMFNEDDDDDDENPQMHDAHAFLQFLANSGHPMGEGFPAFFSGIRRPRRTGNIQDTEEDFGPEDYEVIPLNLFYTYQFLLLFP